MTDEFTPAGEPDRRRVIPPAPPVRTPPKASDRRPRVVWRDGEDCLIFGCDEDVKPKARWCEKHGGDPRANG